jgi:hypothetical protein
MRRVAIALLVLLFLLATGGTNAVSSVQNPPRLIADNRTQYLVDIYAWNGTGWGFVSRLGAKSWIAFPNATQGSYWRATIGQAARDHQVRYIYEPSYGGYQSVWIIQ